MRNLAKVWLCAFVVIFFACVLVPRAEAQPPSPAITVRTIEIHGNRRVDRSTILFYIRLAEGKSYTNIELIERIREDVRTVYGLGFFRDVRVQVESFEGGLRVIYVVAEKPTISSITFTGNVNVDDEKIRERLTIKVQTIVNEATIKETVRNVRKLYQEKGYYFARVEAVLKEGRQNTVSVNLLIDEGESVRIETISFRGNESISKRELLRAMETSEEGFWSFITQSGIYNEDELQKDLVRVRLLYESRGFFKVQVGQPIIREDRERGKLQITVPISEGFVYKMGEIEIRGGEDVIPPEDLKRKMALFPGETFNRTLLIEDVQMITNEFAERGYAFADIRPLTKADDQKKTVALVVEVNKGQRVYIGRVNLKGNDRTRENVIRRQLRVTEGALYNAKGLRNTRTRLSRLGYFESVKVLEKRRPDSDDVLDIEIEVKEKPTGSIAGGAGFNSNEGAIFTAEIREDNLFGRGYITQLFGRFSGRRFDLVGSFTDPDFRDLGFSLGGDLFFADEEFETFDNRQQGGRVRLGKELREFLNGFLSYQLSTSEITNVAPTTAQTILNQEGQSLLESTLTPSLVFDDRNRRIFPTKGVLLRLVPSVSGGPLGGDIDLLSFEGEYRRYESIGKRIRIRQLKDLVWVFRTYIRYLDSFEDQVPAFRRIFSGTRLNTLRGFRTQDLGPVDANGEAIGGLSSALFTVEVAHPFIGPTQLAVFVDAGNIWERHNFMDLGDLRWGGGFGLRLVTPVGPIRVDIGYKLDKKSGERPREVHVGLGAVF